MSTSGMQLMSANNKEQGNRSSAPERMPFLDNMRAIAIFMVVGVHAMSYSLDLPSSQGQVISFIVHTIAVPIFFLVDGYLLVYAIEVNKYNYQKVIKNSFYRLLVPWFIFTIIYTLARYAFELTGFLKDKLIVGYSWNEIIISAYGSVYAPQMYFLVSLFLIRLCIPIVKILCVRSNYYFAIFSFFVFLILYDLIKSTISSYLDIPGGQEPLLHAFWGMQFYIVGIIMYRTLLKVNARTLFIPFFAMFVIALVFHSDFWGYDQAVIQYLYLLTFFFLFAATNRNIGMLDAIGRNTMGIYLVHAPILIKAVSIITNKLVYVPLLSYLFILMATFILSYYLVKIINYVPYGALLFGAPYKKA